MGMNLVALMTPDETFFLKSDPDDEARTQVWFEELRQAMKTARALQLGRHVNDKEFFERAFDVQLVRNPKLDKKMKNDPDRPRNICEGHPQLEGQWRFCIYPHTALLCKRGIEPPKDESRIPASHVPPFDKDDYIELPRDMVVKKKMIGKFYYIQFSHGFPKYGRCELFLMTDHSDTAYYIDAQWEHILCKHKDRQRKGIQYPLDDSEYEAASERRTSNPSRYGGRRNPSGSQTTRKVPDSSLIANTNVPLPSSISARSTLEWRGGATPETLRKASVTRPMSFGIGSPLGVSSYLQSLNLQPRAHSVSEQGAPSTPSSQPPPKNRKYSQKSEEVYSQEHLTNKVLLDQANKRASRRACIDNCPVMMSFSAGEETEDSGGTLLPPGPDDRSPRIHRRESPLVSADTPETVETQPRPSFEYTNFVVDENAAVPILNDLHSLGGVVANSDDYEQYDAAETKAGVDLHDQRRGGAHRGREVQVDAAEESKEPQAGVDLHHQRRGGRLAELLLRAHEHGLVGRGHERRSRGQGPVLDGVHDDGADGPRLLLLGQQHSPLRADSLHAGSPPRGRPLLHQ
uniref:PH domain-containing protein n=1 Tax=Steinernema glaseri TaxID=37863 RepID=A0A1I7YK72_9BILA